MMAEISCPFYLIPDCNRVKNAHIGGDVYIRVLDENWLKEVKAQCPRVAARESFEPHRYTHRLCIQFDEEWPAINDRIDQAKQLILSAIVLSRIVKPTSIASSKVWIQSFYSDSGPVKHVAEVGVGFQSVAYVADSELENTLTRDDAVRIAELWDSLQFVLSNESTYRRIVRAIKLVEIAYHIYYAEVRHITFHAALESMIATSSRRNRQQITKRLPQLIQSLTESQAAQIYDLCCDVKHAATPLQLTPDHHTLERIDQQRYETTKLLEQVVRELLYRVLSNRELADTVADPQRLKVKYPV